MKKLFALPVLGLGLLLPFSSISSVEAASTKTTDELTAVTNDQIVPLSTGWDAWFGNPDEEYVTPGYNNNFDTVSSGGGNYKVRCNANYTGDGTLDLMLYEDDGDNVNLKKTTTISAGEEKIFDVSGYVDGDDGKAELFVKIYAGSGHKDLVSLSYWD